MPVDDRVVLQQELFLAEGQVDLGQGASARDRVVGVGAGDVDLQHAGRRGLGQDRLLEVLHGRIEGKPVAQLLGDDARAQQADVGRHRRLRVAPRVVSQQQGHGADAAFRDHQQPARRSEDADQREREPEVPQAPDRRQHEGQAHGAGLRHRAQGPGVVGDVPRGALHWALPVQGGSRSTVGRVPVPRDGSGACCSRSCGSRRPVVWSRGSGSATSTPLTRKPDS